MARVQGHFRVAADDDPPATCTFTHAVDEVPVLPATGNSDFILFVELYITVFELGAVDHNLQYRINGGPWNFSVDGPLVSFRSSPNVENANLPSDSHRLPRTGGHNASDGAVSRENANVFQSGGPTGNWNFIFSLRIHGASLDYGDTIDFRIVQAGAPLGGGYDRYASFVIEDAPPPAPSSGGVMMMGL